ncbi:hypothetical protein [Methylopila turkensis]|uniref:Uncharacterized protein n=1 Tax=Methylopila turkensis TaxID=1437816 RepID=A0A9W6JLQ3_9HYPH|nr:hypothetical protein [Methylopila turkensis]GLK79417.1 hypothetical protein GCM10008174_11580 [Methylopila turkensis]
MKSALVAIIAALVFVSPASTTTSKADSREFMRMFNGYGAPIIRDISRRQQQAERQERARIAYEREQARRAELKRSKQGRQQLAREDAAARKRAEQQRQAVNTIIQAVGASMIGGGGGGDDVGSDGRTYNERASAYSACRGGGGLGCTSQ